MSLFLATFLIGLSLAVLGVLLLLNKPAVISTLKALPRSQAGSYAFFGAGAAWFLWLVAHLGEADFGEYRSYLFIGFAAVAVLSFYYVPDFLAVRGLSVLVLLAAHPLLQTAFMHYEIPSRLFMVSFIYLAITVAIVLGVVPYRLRDFFIWLFATKGRPKALGTGLLAYGLLLIGVAASY